MHLNTFGNPNVYVTLKARTQISRWGNERACQIQRLNGESKICDMLYKAVYNLIHFQ